MTGAYLMLNTPTPRTDRGTHGPTVTCTEVVRAGHGEGPQLIYGPPSLRLPSNWIVLSPTVPEDPKILSPVPDFTDVSLSVPRLIFKKGGGE